MDKDVMYIHTMEYYSAIKRNGNSAISNEMNLQSIMLSEISQRKTNTLCYHLYVESEKQSPSELPPGRGR